MNRDLPVKSCPIASYRRAVSLLEDRKLFIRRFPQDAAVVEALGRALGVTLPPSYATMLRECGLMLYSGGDIIYGIGLGAYDTKGGSGVHFLTLTARRQGRIGPTMVRIMSSGYGPEFCLECAEADAHGEAPVYLVPANGDLGAAERVAESFGAFLLQEVETAIAEMDADGA